MASWLNRGGGFKPRSEYEPLRRTPFVRKKAEERKRNYAKRLGTAKPRPGSKRDLEKQLECRTARYVKLRDRMRCVQYGDPKVKCAGPLDAGHLYPKGKFKAGKFLPENIHAQCRAHNTAHVTRPELMIEWFIRTHGFEALEALHARCVSDWRPDETWLREQIEERERQIAELELLAVA